MSTPSRVHIGVLAVVAALGVVSARAQSPQRFCLRLPKQFESVLFQGGGVLKIPKEKIQLMEFVLGPPAGNRIPDGKITVQVNREPYDPVISHAGGALIVTIKATDEPDILAQDGSTKIDLNVRGMSEFNQKWVIEPHDLAYAVETVGDDDGVPLELKLSAPPLPLFVSGGAARPLTFRGSVNRKTATVTVNGEATVLTPKSALSSEFNAPVSLAPNQRQVVVAAVGGKEESCRLIIPVRRL